MRLKARPIFIQSGPGLHLGSASAHQDAQHRSQGLVEHRAAKERLSGVPHEENRKPEYAKSSLPGNMDQILIKLINYKLEDLILYYN